jgi:hypothetical protein
MRAITWGLAALAGLLVSGAAMAEDLAGEWRGTLEAGGKTLRVAFHVTKVVGGYSGTGDSLDQGIMGLEMANIVTDGQSLTFTLNDTDGRYAGKWDAARQQWVGVWTQGSALPLNLSRGPAAP